MISIQQMQYIVVLSEERQFQKASERCFVTQPTLSMQVKKAEEQLGYLIFNRDANPIRLTPSGEKLLPILRELLMENEKIKHLSNQIKGHIKEEIRIGIIPTVACYLLPKLFAEWRQYVELKLAIQEMKTEELLESIQNRSIDFGILAGPHQDARIRSLPLYQEEILVYAPKIKEASIPLLDLQTMQPWLLNHGNCLRTQMIQFCQIKSQNEENDWNYEGGNIPLIMEMVDRNGGYTLIPENFPLTLLQKKGIKSILGIHANPAREIIGVCSNRTAKMQGIEEIVRSIQFAFGSTQRLKELQILDWK